MSWKVLFKLCIYDYFSCLYNFAFIFICVCVFYFTVEQVVVRQWILTGYLNIYPPDSRRGEAEFCIEWFCVRQPVKIHRLTYLYRVSQYTHTHTYPHVNTCTHTLTVVHTHTHTHTRTHKCTNTHTWTHAQTHKRTNTHTHTNIHTHTNLHRNNPDIGAKLQSSFDAIIIALIE